MDTQELTLNDVFDMSNFQFIQDSFSKSTGFATVLVDKNGYVTSPSNFTDYHLKCLRGYNNTYQLKNEYKNYKTDISLNQMGVITFEIPIVVKGIHMASVFGGQVLESPLNELNARNYARSIDIDENLLISTAKNLEVISIERVTAATNLLGPILIKIISVWEKNNMFGTSYQEIINTTENVRVCLSDFYKNSDELNSNQEDLVNEIENINDLLLEINSIVKSVSSLADETQMISFNASIEAARAGEQGKSFTVIASEIRRLSEQSKKTVANIQNFTATIQSSINKTTEHSKNCMHSIKSEISELNKINDCINKILESLNKMSS